MQFSMIHTDTEYHEFSTAQWTISAIYVQVVRQKRVCHDKCAHCGCPTFLQITLSICIVLISPFLGSVENNSQGMEHPSAAKTLH